MKGESDSLVEKSVMEYIKTGVFNSQDVSGTIGSSRRLSVLTHSQQASYHCHHHAGRQRLTLVQSSLESVYTQRAQPLSFLMRHRGLETVCTRNMV